MVKIFLVIIAAYLLLLWDFTAIYTSKTKSVKIEYTGLIWVWADHLSIWYYKSDEKPIKWFKITQSDLI